MEYSGKARLCSKIPGFIHGPYFISAVRQTVLIKKAVVVVVVVDCLQLIFQKGLCWRFIGRFISVEGIVIVSDL